MTIERSKFGIVIDVYRPPCINGDLRRHKRVLRMIHIDHAANFVHRICFEAAHHCFAKSQFNCFFFRQGIGPAIRDGRQIYANRRQRKIDQCCNCSGTYDVAYSRRKASRMVSATCRSSVRSCVLGDSRSDLCYLDSKMVWLETVGFPCTVDVVFNDRFLQRCHIFDSGTVRVVARARLPPT